VETGLVVLITCSTPSTIYYCSLPSPRTAVAPHEITRTRVVRKSSTADSSGAGATKVSGSITEGLVNNSWPEQLNH